MEHWQFPFWQFLPRSVFGKKFPFPPYWREAASCAGAVVRSKWANLFTVYCYVGSPTGLGCIWGSLVEEEHLAAGPLLLAHIFHEGQQRVVLHGHLDLLQ